MPPAVPHGRPSVIAFFLATCAALCPLVLHAREIPPPESHPVQPAPGGAVPPQALLRFLNDDRLHGTLESFSSNALTLDSPTLRFPTAFPISSLHEMVLPFSPDPDASEPSAITTVTLTNDDVIRGQLAGADDASVSIITPFAGMLSLNRLMVRDVRIQPSDSASFVGPTGLDGWQQTSKNLPWSYSRGSFRSRATGGIGRLGLLADANRIAFDLAWKGDSIGCKVKWFTTSAISSTGRSGYELTLQRGSIYLRNRSASNTIANLHLGELLENTRIHLEILSDKRSGKTGLYVNNRFIDSWTDPDARTARFGSGIQFHATNPAGLKIENLRISPWDGSITDQPDPKQQLGQFNPNLLNQLDLNDLSGKPKTSAEPEKQPDRMQLANGDSITGQLKSVAEGVITLTTPLGEVSLPVSRLRTLVLKPVPLERCIRREGDVRAHFSNGSSMTFRLISATRDSLTGDSQNFGSTSFRLESIRRIEFNIYPKPRESRPKPDW